MVVVSADGLVQPVPYLDPPADETFEDEHTTAYLLETVSVVIAWASSVNISSSLTLETSKYF